MASCNRADTQTTIHINPCPEFIFSPCRWANESIRIHKTNPPLLSLPDDLTPSIMAARPSMALALGQQQVAGLARAATLEQLREKLETGGGEGPERKMARLAEEQQRLMQQAFQHNLLAMASQMPMNLRLGAPTITTRGQCCQVWQNTVERTWRLCKFSVLPSATRGTLCFASVATFNFNKNLHLTMFCWSNIWLPLLSFLINIFP